MFAEPFAVIEGDRDLDGKDEVAFAVDQDFRLVLSLALLFFFFIFVVLVPIDGRDATFSTS